MRGGTVRKSVPKCRNSRRRQAGGSQDWLPHSQVHTRYSACRRPLALCRETRVFSTGFSEKELQRQLDDPRVGRSVNASEVPVVPGYVRIVKLRVVENVKKLSAKLEPQVFRLERVEVLDKPGIHIELAGPAESAFADVSEAPDRRLRNWQEQRSVKPGYASGRTASSA